MSTLQYSFVVPIYNDGKLADSFCQEFQKVFQAYLKTQDIGTAVELIFVDDGSLNDSYEDLKNIVQKYKFTRAIRLSRNFGQHIALSCGYRNSMGQYVGMLNVDMEDPPYEIPNLIERLKQGNCDIVHGLRKKPAGPLSNRITSNIFHILLNFLTGHQVPLNVSTLRVMNRKFADSLNAFNENSRYLPGLELWLGFSHAYIPIEHQARKQGKSSYNFFSRFKMAFESVISFSDLPLRLVASFGFIVSTVGFVLTGYIILSKLFFIDFRPGYTSTVSIIVFLGGVQIFVIGLGSLYIGRILKEVQSRPLYVVRDSSNFKEKVR
jgi:glycosyltransferase involved in cell wall biosynthesis